MNRAIRKLALVGRTDVSPGNLRALVCRRSTSGLTRVSVAKFSWLKRLFPAFVLAFSIALTAGAQQPKTPASPGPQGNPPPAKAPAGYAIQRDVNLVVLHVSVMDEQGRFVPGLTMSSFRVIEDGVPQKIAVFRQEDAPVSMGLLIDNSESMFDKRAQVNAAALTFIKAGNPDDEEFVAHFNQGYSLDLDKDFTNNMSELQKALNRGEPSGSTALYDAVIATLDHLKEGYRDKKVLLVITDGEDNSSHEDLRSMMERAQRSNALIYAIGLLHQENEKSAAHARYALLSLTQATGGSAFFPEGVEQVEMICARIARDIRHQYTVAYYPTNSAHDGSFRALRVEVIPPAGDGKLSVRTRTGYFAQSAAAGN
jgi:Ca-activated chloride channel homolog